MSGTHTSPYYFIVSDKVKTFYHRPQVSCDDGSIKIFKDFSADNSLTDDDSTSEDGESDLGSYSAEVVQKTRLVSAWSQCYQPFYLRHFGNEN